MSRVIGIDPGLTGAIVVLDDLRSLTVHDMPTFKDGTKSYVDGSHLAEIIAAAGPVDLVAVEFVNAVHGASSSSSFTFGRGVGVIDGVLAAMCRPRMYVKPPEWTKALSVGRDKSTHIAAARGLFPHCAALNSERDGRADAALIAEYARRTLAGRADR